MRNHKILVCGGRNFGDIPMRLDGNGPEREHINYIWKMREADFVRSCLGAYVCCHSIYYNPDDNWLPGDITIISGGARGVDTLAIDWAIVHWCKFEEFKADWSLHGKSAGVIRNQKMLDVGCPDVVLAFPGGRGTADMVSRSEKARIRVIKFDPQM